MQRKKRDEVLELKNRKSDEVSRKEAFTLSVLDHLLREYSLHRTQPTE